MKNYSSKQAKRGKTAYRTPHRFHYQQHQKIAKQKSRLGPAVAGG